VSTSNLKKSNKEYLIFTYLHIIIEMLSFFSTIIVLFK